jgi:polyketide biosynthesis enoyl-CoA hydratase PksI
MDNNSVVKLSTEKHIAVAALEEREYGNTFTERFVLGLKGAFARIRETPGIKVVIVHGYDNYFCCGGTKEELRGLYEGYANIGEKVRFTDSGFHDLFLCCEVPVIAAMQGHALGAGLALGCTADIMVMGEQCIYTANFMKYGFTPGFGATYLIPKRFGDTLGNEMLFTARNYYGRELKERGVPVTIVPKQDVIQTAFQVANDLVDKPLISLKVLKKYLTRHIRMELPEVVKKELEMHEITFAQPEVLDRIEGLFGC